MRATWLVSWLALALMLTPCARADSETGDPWPALDAKLSEVRALLNGAPRAPGTVSEAWVHTSQHSAVLYWQTENPATSFVEYGAGESYDQRTESSGISRISGRPFWSHMHRLRDLEPDTVYHYRLVSIGSDGTVIRSPHMTLRTNQVERWVQRIPEDVQGPPYVLNRGGATYLLTEDLTVSATAFRIEAGGITLDLDGHVVTYNAERVDRAGMEREVDRAAKACGIHITRNAKTRVRILNGILRQGDGNNEGSKVGLGANPIYAARLPKGSEFGALRVEWGGDGVSGLFLRWGDHSRIHHCVFEDRGTGIPNRHEAISAVDGAGQHEYDHNLILSTRHQGFREALRAVHNEIYLDSHATNSFGIHMASSRQASEVAHNRVIGVGVHPIAYGLMGLFAPGSCLHDNLAIVECTRKGDEYGWAGSACVRTTWGTHNLAVEDNVLVGLCSTRERGRSGVTGQTRVLWVGLPEVNENRGAWKGTQLRPEEVRGVVRRNTILALGRDDTAKAGAVCVVCKNRSPNLIVTQNLVVSTYGNVVLADGYGSSENHAKFFENVFRREGSQSNYVTIRADRDGMESKATFLANRYEGGASQESLKLGPKSNIVIQHVLEVVVRNGDGAPVGEAEIVIRDSAGQTIFQGHTAGEATVSALVCGAGAGLEVDSGAAPDDVGYVAPEAVPAGTLKVVLTECVVTARGRRPSGPYQVQVTSADRSVTVAVNLVSAKRLDVEL